MDEKNEIYESANSWGLVETTKELLLEHEIENLITFSWFGEKEDPYIEEQTCYTCPYRKGVIIEFFRNINGRFDRKERKELLEQLLNKAQNAECGCYEKFKEQIKEKDGKNPNIRYKEFKEKVLENERE